jgi:hypothetical protein
MTSRPTRDRRLYSRYNFPLPNVSDAVIAGKADVSSSDLALLPPSSSTAMTLNPRLQKIGLSNKPPSDFDNFYTPKNNFFYSQIRYQPLDSRRREIRLLKIYPVKSYSDHIKAKPQWAPVNATGKRLEAGDFELSTFLRRTTDIRISSSGDTLLACELIDNVQLARQSFCALSYHAGSPDDTKPILVDGIPMNLFANLEHAIRCALECWTVRNPNKELWLWADQICINQHDNQERCSQVSMMRDIYRRSYETYICLSNPLKGGCLSWAFKNHREVSVVDAPREGLKQLKSLSELHDAFRDRSVNHRIGGAPSTFLDSVKSFQNCHWWRRSWVYQEFISCSRPTFISGADQISWSELAPLARFICDGLGDLLTSWAIETDVEAANCKLESTREREKFSSEEQERKARYQEQREQYESLCEKSLRDMEASRDQSRSGWIGERDAFVRKTKDALAQLKEDDTHEKPLGLRPAKSQRRAREKIAQDIVWFVSHMARGGFQLGQEPKPTEKSSMLSLSHVLESHSASIKRLGRELEELQRIDICPDGNHPADVISLARKNNKSIDHLYLKYASEHLPPVLCTVSTEAEIQEQKEQKLRAQNRNIKRVQLFLHNTNSSAISSLIKQKTNRRTISDLKIHLRHSRNCDASDPRDRIFAFLGLADPAYGIVPNYDTEFTIVHALIQTATKIIEYEKTLDILQDVHCGRETVGFMLPTWVPDWTSRPTSSSLEQYVERHQNAHASFEPFNASKDGLALLQVRKDNSNDSNADLKVTGIFVDVLHEIEDAFDSLADLQAFTTPDNHRVITTKRADFDDEIWVLCGARKPVVLRPEGELDGRTYTFRGEALLYESDGKTLSSVMYGSIMEKAESSGNGIRDIWLV